MKVPQHTNLLFSCFSVLAILTHLEMSRLCGLKLHSINRVYDLTYANMAVIVSIRCSFIYLVIPLHATELLGCTWM